MNLGTLLAREGKFSLAIDQFQSAATLRPDSVDALANLAEVFRLNGQRERADELYRKILQLDPNHPLARKALRQP